jgi:hypothetical protein
VPTGASLASTHFAQPTQPPYVSALSVQNVLTNRSCIQIGSEPPYLSFSLFHTRTMNAVLFTFELHM